MGRRGDTGNREKGGLGVMIRNPDSARTKIDFAPRCPPVSVSPRPPISASPPPRVPASPRPLFPVSPRRIFAPLVVVTLILTSVIANAQSRRPQKNTTQSSHVRETLSPDALDLVERAINVACLERRRDPQGSVPIDDMQGRPSLPVRSAEAIEGAERAQRMLPVAKALVIESLNQLATEYSFSSRSARLNLQQAINRVRLVRRIKPDMESRDNASVLLRNPGTITFGTIFLAGLPSDEGMISVLGHELVHIADGNNGGLRLLYRAIGDRASDLTGLSIRGQRAEELTSDLVGALAVRSFVAASPSYDPLPRRISRAVAHNCVAQDEGDEDHLSPRNTIRALLALNPNLTYELVYGREMKKDTR